MVVLREHDAETINFRHEAKHRLGQHVDRVQYQRYVVALDQPLQSAHFPDADDPFGETETRDIDKTRQRSQPGPGVSPG